MEKRSKGIRWGTILWSIAIGFVVILIGGSALLPSTKRSHLDFERLRQLHQLEIDRDAALPATRPQLEMGVHAAGVTVNLSNGILNTGLAFLALFLIFRPLELVFPAKEQPFFRPRWWTDFCFLAGQYLFFNGAVLWLIDHAGHWTRALTPHLVTAHIAGLNWGMQALLVILLGDFLIYWGHRLQHRVGFLWRFHSIHHSAEHLDWLAAHREHPVDSVYTILLVNLPAYALGFPIASLAWFAGFRGLWAVFIHANVRLPIGPLRMIIGAPELHHWHHERNRESGNYANVSPIMDLIFGTYRCPDHEPAALGIDAPIAGGYFGQLIHPFRRMKRIEERHLG